MVMCGGSVRVLVELQANWTDATHDAFPDLGVGSHTAGSPNEAALRKQIGALETEIHDLAGEVFTIGSPKQLGDVLFATANLARHLDLDPEAALRSTNAKFERRFAKGFSILSGYTFSKTLEFAGKLIKITFPDKPV